MTKAARLIVIVLFAAGSMPATAAVPEYGVTIVRTYPHDPQAFTEGLFYRDGFLYESTGREGQSSIRKTELETGKVLQRHDIDRRYFGEGIVAWKGRLVELTWQAETGFVYDLATFRQIATFHYTGEGWALTHDDSHLIMSDGTSDLRILDPDTLQESGRLHVACEGRPVQRINELEWINGEIFANIWLTNLIIRINPSTGQVVGFIDLTDIAAQIHVDSADAVLNGIAYDASADRLFVTGKLWPTLYEIALSPLPDEADLCPHLP
jgi:glutaminyl-peptide cyclotransferase